MKKNYLLTAACIAALSMAATGCTNDELTDGRSDEAPEMGITEITATTPDGGPSTRLVYEEGTSAEGLTVKWKGSGEQFLCLNEADGRWNGFIAVNRSGGEATKLVFSFNHTVKNGFLFALYPDNDDEYAIQIKNLKNSAPAAYEYILPLSNQIGRLANMKDFDYMTATAEITDANLPLGAPQSDASLSLKFKHEIAVLRLAGLTFPADIAGSNPDITEVSITAPALKPQGKLTLSASALSSYRIEPDGDAGATITTSNTFSVNTTTGKLTENVYICFFPPTGEMTGLKITAKVGSDTYEYTYTGSVTSFTAGNMYTLADAEMTKSSGNEIL